jgi:hypothetical protein
LKFENWKWKRNGPRSMALIPPPWAVLGAQGVALVWWAYYMARDDDRASVRALAFTLGGWLVGIALMITRYP